MNLRKALLASAVSLTVALAHAKDFGVVGQVWPITEIDVRELLARDAARVDWSKPNNQIKESAKNYVDNLPKRTFMPPTERVTKWIDPSIVLSSDIKAPVKDNAGEYSWQVLATKGTRINPLEKFRPVTAFLLFDGADENQVKLVKQVLETEPERIVPIEAGRGNLKDTNKAIGRSAYFASDAMISRYEIDALPSLVYPGFGPRSLYLGVTSYPVPYKADDVLSTWPDLGYASPAKKGGQK